MLYLHSIPLFNVSKTHNMDVFIVIGLKDFSVTGHRTVGAVALRVGRHRNTVADVFKADSWVQDGRVSIGDYLVIRVSIEGLKKRGLPINLMGHED